MDVYRRCIVAMAEVHLRRSSSSSSKATPVSLAQREAERQARLRNGRNLDGPKVVHGVPLYLLVVPGLHLCCQPVHNIESMHHQTPMT